MRTMGDWELLEEYAKHRSESAFAELVQRHLNWVYSSALRQVGDQHLAKDVTQSVFILLARKAGQLRPGTIVSGWLFRTTRFVASRALRSEYRRKVREQAASVMSPTDSTDDNQIIWNQLAPYLDQAVAALSDSDRSAILLRFYEKRTLREVGEQLGISEDAAKKRVTRAVEKMRTLLTRHGLVLGGAGLAVVLAEQTVQAAPANLAIGVVKAAAVSVSSSSVLPQLARETLHAWHLAKLKLAAGIAAAFVMAGFLAVQILPRRDQGVVSLPTTNAIVIADVETTTIVQPSSARTTNSPVPSQAATKRVIDIHVVDAQTKQPLPAVNLDIYGLQHEGITGRTDMRGRYEIELPEQDPEFLQVITHSQGFVSMGVFWHTRSGTFQLPGEFTFVLDPSTSIGGIVQDEQGQPIAGVSVSFSLHWPGNMAGATEEVYTNVDDNVVTDSQGRWQSDQMPTDLARLSVNLKHPEYVTESAQPPPEKLRDTTDVMVMKKGLVVQGVVLDEDARPIEGADVLLGPVCCGPGFPSVNTDSDGRFRFANLAPSPMILTFKAEGHAPELTTVDVNGQTAPLEIRLTKGNVIHGKVVDTEGNPVAQAWVATDVWRGYRSLGWRSQTDAEGRFVWSNAPADEVLFAFGKEGFMSINTPAYMPSLKPVDEEQVITLLHVLRVRGQAVDADTDLPVLKFKVVPGSTPAETNWASWNEHGTMTFTNGQYQLAFDQQPSVSVNYNDVNGHQTAYTNATHLVRVEADGYDPTNSRPFKPDEGDVVFDFHLRKGNFVTGVVRAVDGTPLENAEVILGTRSTSNTTDTRRTKTDANGNFRLLKSGEDYSLTVTHERGFAYVTHEEIQTASAVVVQPWGRIEGTLHIGNRPGTNETIVAATARSGYQTKTQTDDQGNFVMDKVPPQFLWLSRQSMGKLGEPWIYRTDLGSADLHPGETLQLVLGGTGRAVVGHVLAPAGYSKPIDWSYGYASLSPYTTPPEHFATMTAAEKLAWRQAWYKSAEGQARRLNPNGHGTMINDDGIFRLDDVAPGTYRLKVSVNAPPEHPYTINGPRIGEETRTITISDGDPGEPIDLGDIKLMPDPKP
jgi:RNA polymerase sigma factor (sigma-70 family)